VLGATTGPALAAEPAEPGGDRDAARTLAKAGIALYQQGNYEDAIAQLRGAERLFHAPAHLLYLARAHAKLGRVAEAHRLYVDVVIEEIPNYANPAFHKAQATARDELQALSDKVSGVIISVSGAAPSAVDVTVDGRPVPRARLPHGVALAPGDHAIEATAPSMRPARLTVSVASDQGLVPVELVLTPLPADPAPPPPTATPTASPPTDPPAPVPAEPDDGLLVPGVVTLAVGGAALVAGAITGGLTLAQADAIKDRCDGTDCPPDQESEADTAKTVAHTSTALFVIGGVAAATGIVLLLVPSSGSSDTGVRREPRLGARLGPGHAQLFGTF